MQINLCPKCGREPKLREWLLSGEYEIECPHCKRYSGAFNTSAEAVAKWNEMTKGENK